MGVERTLLRRFFSVESVSYYRSFRAVFGNGEFEVERFGSYLARDAENGIAEDILADGAAIGFTGSWDRLIAPVGGIVGYTTICDISSRLLF